MNNFDYLLNMPIYSLTEEKIKNLEESITDLTNKIKTLEETTIEQLWLLDLKEI